MEAPSAEALERNIKKAIQRATTYGLQPVVEELQQLQQQLQHERANGDGRLRLQEALRKQLLLIDPAERNATWPTVEAELKEELYDLEELWRKIQSSDAAQGINKDYVEGLVKELRQRAEQAIKEQNIKEAREVTKEIRSTEFDVRNAATGGAQDAQLLQWLNEAFANLNWRNPGKARQMIQEGLKRIQGGNNQVRDILVELIHHNLIHDDKSAGLLG